MENKVAFITGASRGIGKATALTLAKNGFDLVLSARTIVGAGHHRDMLRTADGKPLAGSLEETITEARRYGAQVLPVQMDLADRGSIDRALDQLKRRFGRVDALVNNATFHGQHLNIAFEDIEINELEKVFQTNVYGPFYLTQCIVKMMLQQGLGGTVVSLTTGGAEFDPPMPVWDGSWGFNYGGSKAAIHRLAGILNVELGDKGIQAFNLQPGVVRTESLLATLGNDSRLSAQYGSAPPEVPAAVIHWLLTSAEAKSKLGKTVHAQHIAKKLQIVPDWNEA